LETKFPDWGKVRKFLRKVRVQRAISERAEREALKREVLRKFGK